MKFVLVTGDLDRNIIVNEMGFVKVNVGDDDKERISGSMTVDEE